MSGGRGYLAPTTPRQRVHVRAVFFDLHATLAGLRPHFGPPDPERVSRLLRDRGLSVSPKAWKDALAQIHRIDYPRYGYPDWETYIGRAFEIARAKPNELAFKEVVSEYQRTRWNPLPFAKEAVRRAKKLGLKTALVTSIARFRFERDLRSILDRIDFVVDGNTFHCDKSGPEMYLRTLQALKVKPGEAVMIGDELEGDVLIPTRIGMRAILIHKEKPSWEESQAIGGQVVARDLRHAMDIVDAWVRRAPSTQSRLPGPTGTELSGGVSN
ncbi:MAG: HAD family hydrolase [Nitrososphaerales archaeon]|jgi:FMN phosphatase YigB (HAD superfamily)